MSRILATLFIFYLFIPVGLAGEKPEYQPQAGYTTDLLKEPIYSETQIVIRATKMNNWLNEHYEKLTLGQIKNVREDLYYMISSYAKNLYTAKKRILPDQPDIMLDILLSWADRLGIYGGTEVFTQIRTTSFSDSTRKTKLPDFLTLDMENDLIKVTAKADGWHFKIPYYFMIFEAKQFAATNGMQTQMIVISTGASKDNSEAGRSQSTIMLIYSPEAELTDFSEYWQKVFEIKAHSEEKKIVIGKEKSLYTYDKKLKLHKELISWQEPKGSFAVAYLGIDGTYQWNRPHFLDFLGALKVDQEK
ncbi:hypothetical protein MNBD_ALPHA01-2196 [hydrothermal vent metagenome]|uniref:Uncharacterized protein n=1 Tax=hydrothermal vent metagenome TaxID=652676 RepID=A0A3B0SGY9_9ZZZZ